MLSSRLSRVRVPSPAPDSIRCHGASAAMRTWDTMNGTFHVFTLEPNEELDVIDVGFRCDGRAPSVATDGAVTGSARQD